jgi:hypothetical protein
MNTKIDWVKKLTSRKFWAAVCSLVAQMVVAFGGTEDQGVRITALIMAGATVIAYIIGEGLVDAANKEPEVVLQYEDQPPLPEADDDNG